MAVYYPGNILSTTEKTTSTTAASGMWSMPAHVQKTKSGSWPSITPPPPTDQYFNRTTLLLHGDSTNNANNTVFVDSSTNAITLTTNGKPYQGTFSPFSQTGWSNYFTSGTSDFLSIADNAAFAPTTAFTVEAWIYPTVDARGFIVDQMKDNSASGSSWYMYMEAGRTIQFGYYSGSTQYNISSSALTLNTWTHVAGVWNGTATYLYINGVQASTTSTSATPNDSSLTVKIGAREASASTAGFEFFSGYISNVRFVKNSAVYTGAFTPSITPLTAVSGTSLLTCQSNSYKDNSTNAFTVTSSGSPSVQPFSPFAPSSAYSTSSVGGSILFNGSTDYLSSTSTAFGVGSGNFTVEFWAYKNNVWSTGNQFIVDNGATNGMQIWVNTGAGALRLGRYGVDVILDYAYSSLTPNQWYHMAYVRSGTSVALFINGTRVATATSSASFLASSTTQNIGRSTDTTSYWNGYISNLRVINGTAAYDPAQTTITVPTAPLTAVASTSLLLNATNAGIIDHTAKNNLTTSTAAIASTTQSKFGGSSISLSSASSSYLQMISSNFNTIPASTNFTLECWLYTAASSLAPAVWHNVSSTKIIAFYLTDAAVNTLYTIAGTLNYPGASNSVVVRATSDIVANTWTHVAFVRSGSTITIYINGTAAGTGTSSYASNPLQLIGAISTTTTPNFYFFNGYIDDLRLTIGVARYTGNFTPTTTAFENQ